MTELRIEDVPERWRARYERAVSALEYGQCGNPTTFENDIAMIEEIVRLTAQLKGAQALAGERSTSAASPRSLRP